MIKAIIYTLYSLVENIDGQQTQVDRYLYLVQDDKGAWMEFYKSSGISMPEENRKGNIYPILGIIGEGEFGKVLYNFYKGLLPNGLFAKHMIHSTPRNSIEANFDRPSFYKEAMELETLEKYNFEDITHIFVDYNKFVSTIDYLYKCASLLNIKKYYPAYYIKKHNNFDLNKFINNVYKKYGE